MEETATISVERLIEMKNRETELLLDIENFRNKIANESAKITDMQYEVVKWSFTYNANKTEDENVTDTIDRFSLLSKMIELKMISKEYAGYLIRPMYRAEKKKRNDKE